mmetsp:Transcript_12190/g.30331  ORF Transcript_12190/g.30331 Transcript_12190/m.30331 type:complete len:221 (+) Transcript_12190:733-1395(+)
MCVRSRPVSQRSLVREQLPPQSVPAGGDGRSKRRHAVEGLQVDECAAACQLLQKVAPRVEKVEILEVQPAPLGPAGLLADPPRAQLHLVEEDERALHATRLAGCGAGRVAGGEHLCGEQEQQRGVRLGPQPRAEGGAAREGDAEGVEPLAQLGERPVGVARAERLRGVQLDEERVGVLRGGEGGEEALGGGGERRGGVARLELEQVEDGGLGLVGRREDA